MVRESRTGLPEFMITLFVETRYWYTLHQRKYDEAYATGSNYHTRG